MSFRTAAPDKARAAARQGAAPLANWRMAGARPRGLLLACGMACTAAVAATEGTYTARQMAPETALAAASAALASCRSAGYQVSVAVVDRAGLVQALLRDRFAGAHTLQVATDKAWSSASFRISTAELAQATASGELAGLRQASRVMAVGGGLPIESSGSLVGGIGVSGAPGSGADEKCARAGRDAIEDALGF